MPYEPTFSGYQILGDSQLLRFSKRFTTLPRRKSNGDISFGLCVSGQKIEDLLRRIRKNENKISEKLILMIGTNDILQNTGTKRMCFFMDRILLQLIKYGAIHIILMTVPPIPRLENDGKYWKTLKTFNEFIRKQHNGDDLCVIDAYAKFVKKVPERIELKPFGSSQHVNRIDSNFDGTAVVPSIEKEYNGKQCSSSEDDSSSFEIENDSEESKMWLERRSYFLNSLSNYACDTDFSEEIKGDSINHHYFERFYDRSKREDLIHLNIHGLEQIKELIIKEDYIK